VIWRCPKCKGLFVEQGSSLICENGHSFDRARQGYVHLLLANQKASREPGDNETMISARRHFLSADFYAPLVEEIVGLVPCDKGGLSLLDLGCGEGHYLQSVVQGVSSDLEYCHGYGVDISKPAVRKAASSYKMSALASETRKLDYAVASSVRVPADDACVDGILVVFAPCEASEIVRLLKPDGFFIQVSPGPKHLYELKECIYPEVKLHSQPPLPEGMSLRAQNRLNYSISIESRPVLESLLEMTPFTWRGNREAKSALLDKGTLQLEIDFIIQVATPIQLK